MLCLTCRAMAQLAVQGSISTDLVLDFAAVAAGLVLHIKSILCVVHTVRITLLPVMLAVCAVGLLVAGRMVLARLVVRTRLETFLLCSLTDIGVGGRHVG